MRALAALAGLAGVALVFVTAGGGGQSLSRRLGWTGYAPLGHGGPVVCDPSTGRLSVVLPNGKRVQTVSGTVSWTKGSGPVVRERSSQIVCAVVSAGPP